MTKWLPTLVTLVLGLLGAFEPSIQAYVSAHPQSAVVLGAIYALIKGLAASPVFNNAAKPNVKAASALVFALLIFGISRRAHAQTATPPENPAPTSLFTSSMFSLTAAPIALPGGKSTAAGVLAGGTLNVTQNLALRQSNFIAPESKFNGYFGGIQYAIPSLAKWFNSKSSLTLLNLQPYVTASAGLGQVDGKSHYAFLAGGGMNYAPTKGFTLNLFEVQYARLPGLANNTVIVSAGPQLRF